MHRFVPFPPTPQQAYRFDLATLNKLRPLTATLRLRSRPFACSSARMSTISLSDCITPSRSSIISNPFGQTSKKGGGKSKIAPVGNRSKEGIIELPDYISPPPKDSREKREWDRMSTRMQGFHSYCKLSPLSSTSRGEAQVD